jgi:hypothetical protein
MNRERPIASTASSADVVLPVTHIANGIAHGDV